MKKNTFKKVLATTALALGMSSTVVFAGENDKELQISLGAFKSAGADSGTISGEVTYGKYVTPHWVLGVIQGVNYAFIDNQDDVWTLSTVGYANYNFGDGDPKKGSFVPFAGAFIGTSYNDEDSTGTIGPNLGFKYYVNDTTFITTRYRYEWFFDDLELNSVSDIRDDINIVSDNKSDGNNVISIGLGFRF